MGTPPPADAVVEVYASRTGSWYADEAGDVGVGGELVHDGHLYRVLDTGLVDLGAATVRSLLDADAAVTEVSSPSSPDGSSWVRVLADAERGHARLADVKPGDRFAFQGRVYETLGKEGVERFVETGEVLGRVVNTFVRMSDAVLDVDIAYADGSSDTLTGTPNHPFWVPSVQDYIELQDLEVGTVLRTYGGSEATVLGLTWKPGEVEVYDIEVEGLHNFYVRGEGSDAAGVLVHNSTPKVGTSGGPRAGKPFTPKGKAEIDAENAARNGGKNVCENCGVETVPGKKSERGVTPPGNERQRDYIIPKSKGGDGDPSNGQVLCRDCNLDKSDKTP